MQESVAAPVHPALRPFVASAVGYRQEGMPPGLHRGIAPEVAEAWRLTTAGCGRLRVADLAARVGWSARHLGARFRAETGFTPKEAARVVRFDRARRALAARVPRGGPPDLAALAVAAGCADQAHLTRDWRAFSGLAATRWLAAEVAFVQDGTAAGAGGSPA